MSIMILTGLLALFHLGLWGVLISNLAYLRTSAASSRPQALPDLTVCIPARNEAANLRRLLPSLLRQDYPSFEIIVLDDGSEDDTWSVLQSVDDSRLTSIRGEGPPEGWIGKVYALYQCTRHASGSRYLFLDADAEFSGPKALRRLVGRHESATARVTTGFPQYRGAAHSLVSLVPYSILTGLPWSLVDHISLPALSALNGQCWLIDAALYHRHEPHAHLRDAVLEDVAIGRYLKSKGHPPVLLGVQDCVSIFMYRSFGQAWRGFRKNGYLLMGGTPPAFLGLFGYFTLTWILAPVLSLWFLASLYGLRFVTDRASGFSLSTTLLTPVSFVLGLILQLDSAFHHWTNQVSWKGRSVPSGRTAATSDEPDVDVD